MSESTRTFSEEYDFGGATFDLNDPGDLGVLRFVLSQALYGESTGVYCGKSLYAARSLEAANFYVRQAAQELGHLHLFAQIFRDLGLTPQRPHPVIRLFASHNNYYPLKVFMEHLLGEGMVLDVFKDLIVQTLPDSDPRVPLIKKKLRVVCDEEREHMKWGERETRWVLERKPWLKVPFYGLFELQMSLLPFLVRGARSKLEGHPVLSQAEPFLAHVRERVRRQGQALGFVPEKRPGVLYRTWAVTFGLLLYLRSKLARAHSRVDKIYLKELGFEQDPARNS